VPRHYVDLAGEAGDPEGVDDVAAGDHDVGGNAGGQVHDILGRPVAVVWIAEGPAPLLRLGLDSQRRAPRQRQEPLARDQSVGDERRQDDGWQAQPAEQDPAVRRHGGAPARTQERQREQAHDQREEHSRAGEHHPP
jgi:hypothetical protein